MATSPLTRDKMAAQLRRDNPRFAALLPEMAERYLDAVMAELERNQREPWRNLQFDRTTEARGRNGWFVLNDGTIDVYHGSAICASTPSNTAQIARLR